MITWEEALKWQTKEKAFLDTKDLRPFLEQDKEICRIMDDIEEAFDDYTEETFIFNCMSHCEFIEYLQNRYPDIRFYDYTEYRVR